MNNIFEISGDEIKRILSLHEESTKQQYLNVLNEQSKDTYTTTQDHSGYMYIPKGTIFSKGVNGVLTTFTNGFTMYYNCNGKFYIVNGYNQKQYDAGLTKELANFCLSQRSINKTQQTTNTSKPYETKQINYLQSTADSNVIYKINVNSKFEVTTNPKIVKSDTSTVNVDYQTKQEVRGQYTGVKKYQGVTYYCGKKLFFINGIDKISFRSGLSEMLEKTVCYTTPMKPGTKVLEPIVIKKGESNQQKPVTKQTPQQFAQQVKTYNTQIQTSLGSQKPTGQITDADLDNILTKLG